MKKLTTLIILLIQFVLITSCEKFLDVAPRDSASDDNTIVDPASARTAVRGLYRSLADNNYYGNTFQANAYLQGGDLDWTDTRQVSLQFINHDVRADNSELQLAWTAIYNTINRANHIIAKVPNVQGTGFTDAERNSLVGEAYFVRALAYFDLVRTWGGVQITLTPTLSLSDKTGIKRSSVDQVYQQVLEDLEAAEERLAETTNRIRATKKTVWALKARVHLYRKNWDKAEQYAGYLIADNNYVLKAPYNSFFANGVIATVESILETSYSATYTNSHRTQWQPSSNGGTRRWAPSDAFVHLITDPVTGGNRSALVAKAPNGQWYGNLYYRSPATDPAYILRIAEMYLIRAEARAHLNKISEGLQDLNAVRTRAGLSDAQASSLDELLLAVENERRFEFAFEPHRWYDLVRTDRAGAVLNVHDRSKYTLPFPSVESEIDPELN